MKKAPRPPLRVADAEARGIGTSLVPYEVATDQLAAELEMLNAPVLPERPHRSATVADQAGICRRILEKEILSLTGNVVGVTAVVWREDLPMMRRRAIPVAAVVATFVLPLAAFAQSPTGSVTTDPVQSPAPALSVPLMLLLAVGLSAVAVYKLRRTAARSIVVVLVAAVTVLGGLSYAFLPGIDISGADCLKHKTNIFYPFIGFTPLTSDCQQPIRITDITLPCTDIPAPSQPCTVGQILDNGQTCTLPSCGCPAGQTNCSGTCTDTSPPLGSYSATCSDCSVSACTLTCTLCLDDTGFPVWSPQLTLPCSSDIANCNGVLTCGGCTTP